jgi:hypothetical protein
MMKKESKTKTANVVHETTYTANAFSSVGEAEAELQLDEIKRGLRNPDGSIPLGPESEPTKIHAEERRPGLSQRLAFFGMSLANWLNDSKGTPECRRVCNIIEILESARKNIAGPYAPTLGRIDGHVFKGRVSMQIAATSREYEKQMSRLHMKSLEYTFFPAYHYPLERGWEGSWEPAGKRVQRSRFRVREPEAVRWLHEIATNGELDRLRQCDCRCGMWFFARRLDRRFVGNHRQNDYRNSAEFKKNRAEYMRNYRNQQEKEHLPEGRHHYRHRVKSN